MIKTAVLLILFLGGSSEELATIVKNEHIVTLFHLRRVVIKYVRYRWILHNFTSLESISIDVLSKVK